LTLFVGSLSWNIDDEWLFREFEEFGATSARVVTDREKQRSKGYVAYVPPNHLAMC
jgi:nucleolin